MQKGSPLIIELMRRLLCRGLRLVLQLIGSSSVNRYVARVPYSRLWHRTSRFLWGKEAITLHGVLVEVNPGELHGYYAYFMGDDGTDAELEKLKQLCDSARVFVDVGANAGWISLSIANMYPALSVFAFEPDQMSVARFYSNLEKNAHLLGKVTLIEKAAGDVNEIVKFIPSSCRYNTQIGRVASEYSCNGDSYDVPMIRLDSFFRNRDLPDVVKIDVEGAELGVIRGMTGLFMHGFPKAILIETHAFYFGDTGAEFNSQIVSELKRGGFTLTRHQDDRWVPLANPSELNARSHLLALKDSR